MSCVTQLYGVVVRAPDFSPRGPRFETGARWIFYDLGKVSEFWVLDDGAIRRKGALAVYTPPDRAVWVFGAPESMIRNVVGCIRVGLMA
jgi:hypothetical protein